MAIKNGVFNASSINENTINITVQNNNNLQTSISNANSINVGIAQATDIKAESYPRGLPGRGIKSIEKTSSEGIIDTYTITYTDLTTSTFQVRNGDTSNYDELNNLPSINGIVLTGNKTANNLGLQNKIKAITNSDIEAIFSKIE